MGKSNESSYAARSLYLHVPFCVRKCPYCAFVSAPPQVGDEDRYLRAVTREIALRAADAGTLDTLYIGGGTPTVLSSRAWPVLMGALEAAFRFSGNAEVTVEANPGSLSLEHLRLWRDWRVTRVSIGVQSLDDAELALLGRPHDARLAIDAVAAAQAAGFSVSLDLMFGLPGETLHNWARTLHEVVALHASHLSIYQLTLEPGTPFSLQKMGDLPDGYAPYRYAQWYLPKKGLDQYEVASFARSGCESRHNRNYWADAPYMGIGPGAWGYLEGLRYRNAASLDDYVQALENGCCKVIYEERLEEEAAARQAAVLALRMTDGIDWQVFKKRHGDDFAVAIRDDLQRFPPRLVQCDEARAFLTPAGLRVANRIWEEIV